MIFGAGPVGLCFTRFCKLLGMRTVITIDISDDKTEQARNMGADIVINSSKEDVEAMVLKYLPEGADYVVDAVGINQLLNQGMRLIKYNGKVCGYGISPKLEWIWIGVMHLTTGSYILCNFQERKKRQKHILRLWPGLQRVH